MKEGSNRAKDLSIERKKWMRPRNKKYFLNLQWHMSQYVQGMLLVMFPSSPVNYEGKRH